MTTARSAARSAARDADDEPRPALDARLVPPALAAWAAALVPLALGWGPGLLLTVLALGAATLGGRQLRRASREGSRAPCWAAGLLATGIGAAAVGGVATTAAYQVAGHPLRAAADAGSAATL